MLQKLLQTKSKRQLSSTSAGRRGLAAVALACMLLFVAQPVQAGCNAATPVTDTSTLNLALGGLQ